ncbi:MAG: hypothetical protein JST54_01635 [Deltaproteobacteria bacterium]|nr:hypothetical protein [Deltaproteobacteria bacterium]
MVLLPVLLPLLEPLEPLDDADVPVDAPEPVEPLVLVDAVVLPAVVDPDPDPELALDAEPLLPESEALDVGLVLVDPDVPELLAVLPLEEPVLLDALDDDVLDDDALVEVSVPVEPELPVDAAPAEPEA